MDVDSERKKVPPASLFDPWQGGFCGTVVNDTLGYMQSGRAAELRRGLTAILLSS